MITVRVAFFISVLVFHICSDIEASFNHKHSRTRGSDKGEPAMLTKYIDRGEFPKARRLAEASFLEDGLRSYAGYLTVDKNYGSNMFFWYIPPLNRTLRQSEAPLILWLSGSFAGVSSLFAAMMTNGPYRLETRNPLTFNDHTWAKNAHLLYIDSPVGAGFSYTNNKDGYSTNMTHVAENLYLTLIQFFSLFPRLRTNNFIIAGDGYAGKYIMHLAICIRKRNPGSHLKINIDGIAIGNGFLDPAYQAVGFGDLLFKYGFIDRKGKKEIKKKEKEGWHNWHDNTHNGQYLAWQKYNQIIAGETDPNTLFKNLTGLKTYYNYMMIDGDISSGSYQKLIEEFFNKQRNGWKLNAGKRKFRLTNVKLAEYIANDGLFWYSFDINQPYCYFPAIFANFRFLLYGGMLDLRHPQVMIEIMMDNRNWTGNEAYRSADRKLWKVDGKLAGYVRTGGNMTLLSILNAGHFVPRDQPKWAEHMINTFAQKGEYFVQDSVELN